MGFLGLAFGGTKALAKGTFAGGFAARATIGATAGGIAGAIQGDYANPNARIESVLKGAAIGAAVGGAFGMNTSLGRAYAARNRRTAISSVGEHTINRQLAKYPEFAKDWKRATTPWMNTPTSRMFGGMFDGTSKAKSGFFQRNMAVGQSRAMKELGGVIGTHQVERQIKNVSAFRREFEKRAAELSPVGQTINMGIGAITGAIKHPFATLGVVGGAAGAYGLASRPTSPTLRGDVERAQRSLRANTRIDYNAQMLAAETMRESGVAPMGTLGTVPQMMGPMQKSFQDSTTGVVQGLHRGRHG